MIYLSDSESGQMQLGQKEYFNTWWLCCRSCNIQRFTKKYESNCFTCGYTYNQPYYIDEKGLCWKMNNERRDDLEKTMLSFKDLSVDQIVKNNIHPINPTDRIDATKRVCESGINLINDLFAKWEQEDAKKKRWKFWK